MLRVFGILSIVLALSACSGSSDAPVQDLPDFASQQSSARSVVLAGPPPQTDDIQQFRLQLWDNIAVTTRCGGCHIAGQQSPAFARTDDINLAYEATVPLVDRGTPSQSRLVTKVGGGHNCWLESPAACADIMTTWIVNWIGETEGAVTSVVLIPPELRDPGDSRAFPDDASAFATTIHPLLTQYCADCHTDSGVVSQSPFIASADIDVAYAAARGRIEIDDPAASRLVERLGSEFHNCWSNCADDAAEMLVAINTFVDGLPVDSVDPDLVFSRALRLSEGTVAAGGGRIDTHAIALYEFKQMSGGTAFDTSGVDPALDLFFSGDVSWVGGWGIRIGPGGKAQGSTSSSSKLHDLLTTTGEFSLEAWVVPANVTQEDAYIMSYSGGTTARNVTLGQTLYNYDFLLRSDGSDGNGDPALSTPDADEVLQASLQHVVATFSPAQGRRLYVNGDLVAAESGDTVLDSWDDTFALVLGNEASSDRPFEGVIRLAAVHNRALDEADIRANFEAGVGEQFYLLFGVSHLVDVPEAYIVINVSQFDSWSWLFSEPRFVSLDESAVPVDIPVAGIRIGINGRETLVGQAFANVDVLLTPADYVPGEGQSLSSLGTVVGIEKTPETDEFFLTFERIGQFSHIRVDATPVAAAAVDLEPQATIGIRTFDEINAGFAGITGVSPAHPDVAATFDAVRRALPASPGIEGFLSSQQMAITQLAIEYCNAMVEDTSLRGVVYPGVDFLSPPSTALDSDGRQALLMPMIDRAFGESLATQPDRDAAVLELDALVSQLAATGTNAERTVTIAKATCAATLGNAALLIQ